MTEAVKKLQTEMDANKSNPYIQVIGKFLLQHLEANPVTAEKFIAKDKTIAKSIDAMKTEARKKQNNGMAMLTDAEGYAIVLKYFGIEGAPVTPAAPTPDPVQPAAARSSGNDFNVDLDEFL